VIVHGATPVWVSALSDLARVAGFDVVGASAESELALRTLDQHKPDLLVLEAPSGVGHLADLVRHIRSADVKVKLLVIGEGESREDIANAFAAGADVYVFKNAAPDDVATAMRQAFVQSLLCRLGLDRSDAEHERPQPERTRQGLADQARVRSAAARG
jgi:DNA-binding NarL/FixJ family response regulator